VASIDEKLKKLEAQRAELTAKIQRVKAQTRERERKVETRKKILVGAAILEHMARGAWPEERLMDLLDGYLERNQDRALFGLPPLAESRDDEASG